MNRMWLISAVAMSGLAGSVGCGDKLKQCERAHRTCQEALAQKSADLQDCEMMRETLRTQIESLRNELAAKQQLVDNLTAEKQKWQDLYENCDARLAEQLGRQPDKPIILETKLPGPLHEKLKALAEKYPEIEYDEKKGAVRWKADLLFPSGQDKLSNAEQVQGSLRDFAQIVQSADAAGFDVIVVGHTDSDPIRHSAARFQSNWDLSAYRAIAVMNLMLDQGVSPTRLGIMGYGEYRPIAENTSEAGKAQNRRVEIYLVQQGSVQSMSEGLHHVKDLHLAYVKPSDR